MADKVVDIDPVRRIEKKELDAFKKHINSLTAEDLESLIVIETPKDKTATMRVFGLTFYSLGAAQAILTALGQELLRHEFEMPDPNVR